MPMTYEIFQQNAVYHATAAGDDSKFLIIQQTIERAFDTLAGQLLLADMDQNLPIHIYVYPYFTFMFTLIMTAVKE